MNCDHCKSEITLMASIRQPTPFYFTCPKCKSRYKISTPRMKIIVAGIVALFAGLTLILCLGFQKLGLPFAISLLLLMTGIAFAVEVAMHRYISKHGRFALVEKKQPKPSAESKPDEGKKET